MLAINGPVNIQSNNTMQVICQRLPVALCRQFDHKGKEKAWLLYSYHGSKTCVFTCIVAYLQTWVPRTAVYEADDEKEEETDADQSQQKVDKISFRSAAVHSDCSMTECRIPAAVMFTQSCSAFVMETGCAVQGPDLSFHHR